MAAEWRGNLKEEIASLVRDRILAGAYVPGQRLDQDALAGELGVSRAPVREALILLEADGLVEGVPRRGAFVARLTRDDVQDHYAVFGVVSGLATRRAVGVLDVAQLDGLEALLAEATAPDVDAATRVRLSHGFHRHIHLAGASRRLRVVLRLLSGTMPASFFLEDTAWTALLDDEHRGILAALRARDPSSAVERVEAHFRHLGERAVALLEERGLWRADDGSHQL